MIKVLKYARLLEEFLKDQQTLGISAVVKFKINIRMNFSIDVLVVSEAPEKYNRRYFKETFSQYLLKWKQRYDENEHSDEMKKMDGSYLRYIKDESKEFITADNYDISFNVVGMWDLEEGLIDVDFENEPSIDYGPRLRLNSFFDRKRIHNELSNSIPIVTFYSYKGGMGRTTTMVSYAIDLALNHNKKVFVIDCDLEAPGYLNFFRLHEENLLKEGRINGFVEFLSDIKFMRDPDKIDLDNYIINVGDQYKEIGKYLGLQNIYLMPAGNLNETVVDGGEPENRKSYLEGLSRVNLSNQSTIMEGFKLLFDKIKESIRPDIILIDSRTGFNDIIGTAMMYLSNMVVGFFGGNEQTVPGLLSLLDYYVKSNFALSIVSSIVPKEVDEETIENEKMRVQKYFGLITDATNVKDFPGFFMLHRRPELETLGTKLNSNEDINYLDFIKNGNFDDYKDLFGHLNSSLWKQNDNAIEIIESNEGENQNIDYPMPYRPSNPRMTTLDMRNIILRNLKTALKPIEPFAENMDINIKTFFFRDCMNDFFDEKKFLIRGYKGTGKTYLYKALADPKQRDIAEIMKKRANDYRVKNERPLLSNDALKFLDILSYDENGTKLFYFKGLNLSKIDNPEYYFNVFWLIHTWMSVFQDEQFKPVLEQSKLKENLVELRGDYKSIEIINGMINSGIETLIELENDFDRLNDFLRKNQIKLFLLYDQLDTRINPLNWKMIVSPLVDWWRERWNRYSNILPKIFIRTDLFKRVIGTNTERLSANIIEIEWSIEEVFSYLLKLVFSNDDSANAFWTIAKDKIHLPQQWIEGCKKDLKENDNQFILEQSKLGPAVSILFGKEVKEGIQLGKPWNYFKQNLSNADGSISLRPFVTMLDDNAIKEALEKPVKFRYVTEILPSSVYASRDVRVKTAQKYFDDLAKDDYSNDLNYIRDFINTEKGVNYRFKSLSEVQFTEFINAILNTYDTKMRIPDEIKGLLTANGIIAEMFTRKGKYYQFATMYAYAWGLKSTSNDNESRIQEGAVKFDGQHYYCESNGVKYAIPDCGICEGEVQFQTSAIEKNFNYPNFSPYEYRIHYIRKI